MDLFLPCIVTYSDTQENRKVFQLITLLCIFDIPHKHIKSKCNPQCTAKKYLDAHMLKTIFKCSAELWYWLRNKRLEVWAFRLFFFFFF